MMHPKTLKRLITGVAMLLTTTRCRASGEHTIPDYDYSHLLMNARLALATVNNSADTIAWMQSNGVKVRKGADGAVCAMDVRTHDGQVKTIKTKVVIVAI